MEGILTKIKNSFFSFKRLKKTAIFGAVLFSIFLGLTFPLQPAQAFVQLIGLWVATCVIALVMQLTLAISTLILLIGGLILSWVLSPYFIDIPYTAMVHRGVPTIVGIGWPIVRDFANMFFIIILVAIGLATALRISEYQAKKALPKLIIIALLINFTPVMLGLIIDASNIVMNFFLEELTGLQLIRNQFSAQGSLILQTLVGCIPLLGTLSGLSAMAKTLVMIIFNLVAALIFLMFALLFIMRYVMIWMLVILSPFAFFTLLLSPGTRKTLSLGLLDWDQWWHNFIQWSIIGITGAFFLYLGEQSMVIFARETFTLAPIAGGGGGWLTMDFVEFFGEILQYLVVLAFLIVGFFSATSTSAMGAGFITGAARKYGTMGAKMAGAWAARRGLAAMRGAVPEGLRMRLEGMTAAKGPAWGAERKGLAGYALRAAAGTVGFARGRMAGAAVSTITGGERAAAGRAEGDAKKRDVVGNLNALRDPTISDADRMGIIKGMVEAKQMGDALSEDVVGDKVLTADEAFRAYKKARQLRDGGAIEDMEGSFTHMKGVPERFAALVDQETASAKEEKDRTGELYGRPSGLSEDDVKLYGYTSYKDKIIRSAKSTDDFKKFHKGLWKDKGAIESALQFDAHQIGAATTQFGRAFSDPLQTAAEEKVAERGDLSWFYEVNPLTGKMRAPKLPKYLASNPAQGLYMPLAGAEDINSAKRLEEEGRIGQEIRPFANNELDAELTRTRERESELNQQIVNAKRANQPKGVITGLTKELEGITRRGKVIEKEYDRRTRPTPTATAPSGLPEEEPLAVRIKKAKGEEKETLERARDRFPEESRDQLAGSAIAKLDEEIANLEAEARKREAEIQRMVRIEKAPEETIRPFREALTAKQSEIKEKGEEKKRAITEWQTAINAWRTAHPELTSAQEVARLKEMEEMTKKALSRMKILGKPKEVIEKAEADLQAMKETRTGWEGKLATYLRRGELKGDLDKARGREQEIRQGLTKARGETTRIKGEVGELTKKREETDRQLYSFEEEIGKVSSDIEGRTTRLGELKTEQRGLQKEREARGTRVKELQQEKEDLRKSGLPREQRRPGIQRINREIDSERASLSGLKTVLDKNVRRVEQAENELKSLTQRKVELESGTKERRGQLKQLGADIQRRNKTLEENQKQQNNLEKSLESTLKNINTIEGESERVKGIIESGATAEEDKGYVRNLREGMGVKKIVGKVLPKRIKRRREMKKIIEEEKET